ncbi:MULTISPECIES: GOLPH3/VPS74 family protein [unclassified Streptomyces]|uniref:GOLPH3/VPS74 family protein n=1 Tax=unclassified Streptomyces TaxID=2593676 RepID=UPI0022709A76|nr:MULTISPECIES: GPP34 family phosphoprotein [unclassified Streptomyces]MCY0923684.1 GPP34 family phosphoprotein [Streptomyces sp. H27-G5]MCY0960102.1 GPP34 family phosphoprotein [Streptomyces sp. H27-H5]
MTTAKDLFFLAMERQVNQPVGQGDLSLALAGAELIDLLGAGAVVLDGDRIVPEGDPQPDDRLLGEAAEHLVRQVPHERVEEWLWRRGGDLSGSYQDALEKDGQLAPRRGGLSPFGADRLELVDSPSRSRALSRWEAAEPVLVALASVVGIESGQSEDEPNLDDEAVTTVLAVVNDAVMELEAVRQRRTIENSAFANLWRGP